MRTYEASVANKWRRPRTRIATVSMNHAPKNTTMSTLDTSAITNARWRVGPRQDAHAERAFEAEGSLENHAGSDEHVRQAGARTTTGPHSADNVSNEPDSA